MMQQKVRLCNQDRLASQPADVYYCQAVDTENLGLGVSLMKAAILKEQEAISIEDVETPRPGQEAYQDSGYPLR